MNRRQIVFFFSAAFLAAALAPAEEPWTLERALDHALNHSPDARLAQQRIVAGRAGLDQANAAFWPQVQLQSSYVRTDHPVSVFGSVLNQRSFSPALNFNDVPDIDNLNVRGIVTVPLFNGGRNVAGRDSARALAESARRQGEAVRNTLGFEVARAFHTAHKTREFIRTTEAGVRSLESSLEIARQRFSAGTLLKADVLDVEVRLAQAREDLVRSRHAQALAIRSLRNLLGFEAGEFIVADVAPSVAAPQSNDFSGRPELAAAREQERSAEAAVRQVRGGYQPRVNAFTSLDYDYGSKWNGSGESYTAGVMLHWDLWDGRQTRAKVNEARARLEAAREETRKLRLALDLEVEQARLALTEALGRLAVTEKSVAQAAESVGLTRARFAQGLALSTQLLDAETSLTAASVRRAEAEADRSIAVAALRRALGLPQLDLGSSH